MESSGGKARRVELGFAGGGVLALRLTEDVYRALRGALDSTGGEGSRWHDVESEDAHVSVDLSQVVFVRLDIEPGRVGF